LVPSIGVRIPAPQPVYLIFWEMKVDEVLADEWYKEISDFLEARVQHKDTEAPGSRISALCRVLADAVENADGTREQKLEAIVRLTAMALGLEQKFMIIRDPTGVLS
jgi:hypothetical protein